MRRSAGRVEHPNTLPEQSRMIVSNGKARTVIIPSLKALFLPKITMFRHEKITIA